MYRSLLYRNFLSKKDNAMTLLIPSSLSKPATQAGTDVQGTTPEIAKQYKPGQQGYKLPSYN